jgi:hypothetical protein
MGPSIGRRIGAATDGSSSESPGSLSRRDDGSSGWGIGMAAQRTVRLVELKLRIID